MWNVREIVGGACPNEKSKLWTKRRRRRRRRSRRQQKLCTSQIRKNQTTTTNNLCEKNEFHWLKRNEKWKKTEKLNFWLWCGSGQPSSSSSSIECTQFSSWNSFWSRKSTRKFSERKQKKRKPKETNEKETKKKTCKRIQVKQQQQHITWPETWKQERERGRKVCVCVRACEWLCTQCRNVASKPDIYQPHSHGFYYLAQHLCFSTIRKYTFWTMSVAFHISVPHGPATSFLSLPPWLWWMCVWCVCTLVWNAIGIDEIVVIGRSGVFNQKLIAHLSVCDFQSERNA